MEIKEAETKALSIVDQAHAVIVTNGESYTLAGELWKTIKNMKEEVNNVFKPIIDAAHKAHKEALAQKAKIYDPLDTAGREIKSSMSAYDEEQERIRLEKEIELREEAMRIEEEARLQAAIQAEKAGQKEAAEQILEAPVVEPIVVVPKEVPKMAGGPVYRTIWDAKVVNFKELVKAVVGGKVSINVLLPNKVFLKSQATDLKTTMNFPGVRAFSRRV